MALGVSRKRKGRSRVAPQWAWLALLVPVASCVPAIAGQGPTVEIAVAEPPLPQSNPLPAPYVASVPVDGGLAAASPFALAAASPLDQMRSLDCLAQAIYYEAGSESEDGQRAVAQVVINRVRHPAWPNSVCGVVYQGPMRAGGGCQFTFTCDGSLARRPGGIAWARARLIAAEALAGRTFPGVGLSTHYHASYVYPSWAPNLTRTAVIGAHVFYRLPGTPGLPGAFSDRYAGTEPVPRSAGYFPFRRPAAAEPALAGYTPQAAPVPSDIPQDPRWVASDLPQSTVRDEYRQSGTWRDDAPSSVTGR